MLHRTWMDSADLTIITQLNINLSFCIVRLIQFIRIVLYNHSGIRFQNITGQCI